MKKQICYASIILFAIGIAINSCSKSKSSNVTPTNSNFVGTYKFSSETGKPGTGPQFNAFDSLAPCERDDEVRFNADSSYDYLDVGTVCSPTASYSGTWYLQNSKTLVLDLSSVYTIQSFNNKTLVLVFTDTYTSPATVYTLTLAKQ